MIKPSHTFCFSTGVAFIAAIACTLLGSYILAVSNAFLMVVNGYVAYKAMKNEF